MTSGNHKIRQQDPETIRSMFDAIAPTYDMLNHVLSFGLDIRWRKRAVRQLAEKRGGKFLDIAAGSGDVSLELLSLRPSLVMATDFATNMLEVFRRKINGRPECSPIRLAACDAHELPFADGTFDGTLVAFGIRNFADRLRALREMHRVLNAGGISVILELTEPAGVIPRGIHRLYTKALLPSIGRIISKHNQAYRYLPQSIAEFPERSEFLALMARAGFHSYSATPLSFGAATLFVGRK